MRRASPDSGEKRQGTHLLLRQRRKKTEVMEHLADPMWVATQLGDWKPHCVKFLTAFSLDTCSEP